MLVSRALRETLIKCASTTLSSKLVSTERDYFAEMCVDAIDYLDAGETSLKNVGIKKVHGGALQVRWMPRT
jgi:T-complex protein 1 subunit eta